MEVEVTDTIFELGKDGHPESLPYGVLQMESGRIPALQPHQYELGRQPLRNLDVMLAFIRGTTTTTGLKVEAYLDQGIYRKGRKITERQLKELALFTHDICPRWNYSLSPRPPR